MNVAGTVLMETLRAAGWGWDLSLSLAPARAHGLIRWAEMPSCPFCSPPSPFLSLLVPMEHPPGPLSTSLADLDPSLSKSVSGPKQCQDPARAGSQTHVHPQDTQPSNQRARVAQEEGSSPGGTVDGPPWGVPGPPLPPTCMRSRPTMKALPWQ